MMPEYFSPGVYVEEVHSAHGPIASAPTSITALVGATAKGPMNTATDVTSIAQYRAIFGATSLMSPVSIAVFQFFSNGGQRAVVVRAASAGARSRVSAAQVIGDAGRGTGVHALGHSPLASMLLTPDAGIMSQREHHALTQSVLAFCEEHRIFYLVDPPNLRLRRNPVDTVTSWAARSGSLMHANAAVYFPRVRMADPVGKSNTILVPASGAVAGVSARTDSQRGVWQAPAGTKARLLGITDVEMTLSDAQMARLQSVSINALRPFPGLGILVWGARTFASAAVDSEWKYVPVRRLALFVERSLYGGLQWTVFEPNGEPLWAQIRLSVSSFLNQLFRRGAFAGASAREAYFVRCGRDTMTSSDIHDGRIIVAIGFAPLKPAEFIVMQLELRAAEAN